MDELIKDLWRPHWRKEFEATLKTDLSHVPDKVIDELVERLGEEDEIE